MLLPRHLKQQLPAIQTRLQYTRHSWSRGLAWVLRTRLILAVPLPRSLSGFTIPFIPVILLSTRLVRSIPAGAEVPSQPGILVADWAMCNFLHILLHEAAHQLLAMWPEWQRWFGRRRIYGVDINAADAVSEAVCRDLCAYTRYSGQAITYRCPLALLHPVFRR